MRRSLSSLGLLWQPKEPVGALAHEVARGRVVAVARVVAVGRVGRVAVGRVGRVAVAWGRVGRVPFAWRVVHYWVK